MHEPDVVDVRAILVGGAGIAIAVVAAGMAVSALSAVLAARHGGAPATAAAGAGSSTIPDTSAWTAADRPDARAELAALRVRESALLEGYGWTDAQRQHAHVPIERAMKLAAASGFTALEEAETSVRAEDADP